jgi:hypothetical protein
LFRLSACVTLAEVLATPVSAYLMTSFNIWFPYILGLGILVVGVTPGYFLPETLEDAKAKKRDQVIATEDDDDDQTQPRMNKTMRDEFISKLREFKKSTQFIWKDLNVCLTILMFFVTFVSKQSSNILMQYASKKFHWSIAQVRGALTLFHAKFQTNSAPGQLAHFSARDIHTRQLPTPDAGHKLPPSQVSPPTRQVERFAHEPGKRTFGHYRVRSHVCSAGACDLDLGPGDPVTGLGVLDLFAKFGNFHRSTRSCRDSVLCHGYCAVSGFARVGTIVCRPVSSGNALRRCVDGIAISSSRSILCRCLRCFMLHPIEAIAT